MTMDNFLRFLQQLLTMADPADPDLVEKAENALRVVVDLVRSSHEVDTQTAFLMDCAINQFRHLLRFRDEFAGVRGKPMLNEQRRRRLRLALRPGC